MKQSIYSLIIYLAFISLSVAQQKTDDRKWFQDPRLMNIIPPEINTSVTPSPESIMNYVNKNASVMIQNTNDGSAVVFPNFRVHPSPRIQSETPIVTHPSNKNIMYGSANAGTFNPLFMSEGCYVTTDGGSHWFGSDTTKAAPINDDAGDPAPSIDLNGRFYMSYIGLSGGIYVSNSTDYGATWANATKLITGSQDKNHTFTINNPASPYNGRTFVIWSRMTAAVPPISVSYTTDNGFSWSAAKDINITTSGHYSQGCNGAVAPNGDIYVCWQNPISQTPYTGDYVGFGKSTDGGATWNYLNNIYDCNGIRGNIKTAGIRVNDFPWMAVDNSGGIRNGWIYIVTAEKTLSPAGSDPDIIMHRSTDGGTTWSPGIRVNQDVLNNGKEQYMPCINVDQTGAINVVYYDNRNTTADSTQVFISRSVDGGILWSDIQVSDHTFKPSSVSGAAAGYQGDYIGITEGPGGSIWPYWADNISGIYQAWTTKVVFNSFPLNAYNLKLPASGATINSYRNGTGPVSFTWDTASSTSTYKWTFGSPTLTTPKLSMYLSTNFISLNSSRFDTLLAGIGMKQGDSLVGQWSVMAYRNNFPTNDSLQALNSPRALTLKRGLPQLLAFNLNSPSDNSTIATSIFNYSNVTFNWRKSGDGTKYRLKYGQTLTSPRFDFLANSAGYDTSWSTSNNALDQMLQSSGLKSGESINGIWAVYCYSGADSLKSVLSFNLTFTRQSRGEFIVVYDSSQAKGIISRDSVTNNLMAMNRTYDVFNRAGNISVNSISFKGYNYVIWLGEGSSVMSLVQKDSVKSYLNSGGSAKSKFIMFSEDCGYELDRPLSPFQDTAFSKGMLGFDFIADVPVSGGKQILKGDWINPNSVDSTIGSFPDVLKTSWLGSKRLYSYSSTYIADTGCGIGYQGPIWNTAVFGTDIRALRSAYSSPSGSPVTRILSGAIKWVDEGSTPVELTLFTASAAGNVVNLNWITATETNNFGYAVEKKNVNGIFSAIGFIKGKGTTTSQNSYSFNDNNPIPGNYVYRLKQIDFNGTVSYSSEVNVEVNPPAVFALEQNYPNPFNPSTSINYSIPQDGEVALSVYNILGAKVQTLINQNMKAGKYEVKFDASRYASGIYFYRLDAGKYSSIKKMVLIK